MRAAFLDWESLDRGDIDRTPLTRLSLDWTFFPLIDLNQLEKIIDRTEVIVTNKVVIDAGLIKTAARLKLICVAATGTNNVDLDAASRAAIPVCNVTGYATESVVQHVFMCVLNLYRRYENYRQSVHDGRWQTSRHFCFLDHPIESLSGKIIGIIGYGELGQAVARMAECFGMQVLVAQSLEGSPKDGRVALTELLRQADVLSLHIPLTEQTRNLIGEAELALMKRDALLINTARGGIVDESALLDALCRGRLAGAATDVLENEPPVAGNPLIASSLPSLIVTPHIAWAARQSRQQLVDGVARNIEAWLSGETRHQVNA